VVSCSEVKGDRSSDRKAGDTGGEDVAIERGDMHLTRRSKGSKIGGGFSFQGQSPH
jgi:hypothetical protein